MKELSIEEKAKRYDEAIERAHQIHDADRVSGIELTTCEEIFPELTELEDEKIRKELLQIANESEDSIYIVMTPDKRKRLIAWLERQGNLMKALQISNAEIGELIEKNYYLKEQLEKQAKNNMGISEATKKKLEEEKFTNKVEPKFKIEEEKWYVCTQTFVLRGKIVVIKGQTYQAEKDNAIKGEDGCLFIDKHDGKASDYFRLWTIQDAKDGDVLCDYSEAYDNPLIFILKKFECVNFGLVRPSDYSSYCFLTAGDIQRFKEGTYHHKHNIEPATKEQRALLFQKIKEAGYEWDAEKKELKKLKGKSYESK